MTDDETPLAKMIWTELINGLSPDHQVKDFPLRTNAEFRWKAIQLEASRRTVGAVQTLAETSRRLEGLTRWLVGLTFALGALTVALIVLTAKT